MLSKEEIVGIVAYCQQNKVSYNSRCQELGIRMWRFYEAKRRYREMESETGEVGEFIQLQPGGPMQPSNLNVLEQRVSSRSRKKQDKASGMLSLEVQTRNGTALRLYGEMTPAMLRELVQTL